VAQLYRELRPGPDDRVLHDHGAVCDAHGCVFGDEDGAEHDPALLADLDISAHERSRRDVGSRGDAWRHSSVLDQHR
jgi:hypothetical protein